MNDTPDSPLNSEDETIRDTPETEPLNEDQSSEDSFDDREQQEESKHDSRFTEGEILRFIRVRFPGNNRSFAFLVGKYEYSYGQKVVAMSDRGMAVGFVNSFPYELPFHKGLLPIRGIAKAATEEDLQADAETFRQEKRLETICYKHIERHNLDMQLTHVDLAQFGKKAIFHFTAPARIDFRGLVHDLVGELKMRVELRQVSVRDRSAAVGGLGPCGRELCCSSFLAKYGNVGIKLAKNQDLSLNSSKINGVCGQLKCCLTYEDEVYQQKRKKLPRDNALILTKDGERGKVIRLHIIQEQFEMISDQGIIRRYVAEMWDGPAEGLEMPRYFEHGVTDNTKTIIGLEDKKAELEAIQKEEFSAIYAKTKDWADSIYESLFGDKTLGLSMPELLEPEDLRARKLMPDEEEEITYVPSDEDRLDEDDEDDDGDESDEDDDSDSLPETRRPPQVHPRPQQPRVHQQQPRGQQNRDRQGQSQNQNRNAPRPNPNQTPGQGQNPHNPQQASDRPNEQRPPGERSNRSRNNNRNRNRNRGGNRGNGGNNNGGGNGGGAGGGRPSGA